MTKLKLVNLCLMQWLFLRLARVIDEEGKQVGWALIGPVLPLTGWSSEYIGRAEPIIRW